MNDQAHTGNGWRYLWEIVHSYRGGLTLLVVLAGGWIARSLVSEYLLATDATALRVDRLEERDSTNAIDRNNVLARVEAIEGKLDYMVCLAEHDPRILALLQVNCRVTPDLQ